jgi:hypothetical protein
MIVRTISTPETHKRRIYCAEKLYRGTTECFIDESGSDISRLCLFSFDASASYNPDSIIFDPLNLINMNNQKEINSSLKHYLNIVNDTQIKRHTYARRNP